MKESKFQDQVMKSLRAVGALVFNVHGHLEQAAGWPDLQVYHPHLNIHLELKVRTQVKTHQKLVMDKLIARGTPACVLRWKPDRWIIEHHRREWIRVIQPHELWETLKSIYVLDELNYGKQTAHVKTK